MRFSRGLRRGAALVAASGIVFLGGGCGLTAQAILYQLLQTVLSSALSSTTTGA